MRKALLIGAFVALAVALPRPQDQDDDLSEAPEAVSTPFPSPTIPIDLTTSLNIPVTTPIGIPSPIFDPDDTTSTKSSRSKRPHWEPIPIFTKECKCDLKTARYPCWATDALQRCYYEENFSYGCYVSAAGGCPTPTRVCSALYQPSPRSGRHPCEIGPAPITEPPVSLPTSIPALPSVNITLPGGNVSVPSGNVSWPSANVTLPVPVPEVTTVIVVLPAPTPV